MSISPCLSWSFDWPISWCLFSPTKQFCQVFENFRLVSYFTDALLVNFTYMLVFPVWFFYVWSLILLAVVLFCFLSTYNPTTITCSLFFVEKWNWLLLNWKYHYIPLDSVRISIWSIKFSTVIFLLRGEQLSIRPFELFLIMRNIIKLPISLHFKLFRATPTGLTC